MLERILPPVVRTAYARTDPPEAEIFPAEAALIEAAVAKRRSEFTTVRHCARLALAELGVPAAPILRGVRGAPIWPDGIVGSMTHCVGYRGAAVARAGEVAGIGIDAEVHGPLPEGVLGLVSSEQERAQLARLAVLRPAVQWDRLLFSAKESVYKVWSPLTGQWLGFEDAAVTFDPETEMFTARLLIAGPIETLSGRFLVDDGIVLTAIVLDAPAR
jgi:4'-phosphopantetheinyl transferase EntD